MCVLLLSFCLPPLPEDAPLPATCLGSPAGRRGEALRRDQRQMAERRGSTRQGQILEQIQRREFARRERERVRGGAQHISPLGQVIIGLNIRARARGHREREHT